ncbi:MAG: hypothetical protein KDI19_04385 [Pseudomonadales bacterium]|nr:hypothetical protein [Pseudomonadales bacterium]
METLAVTDSFEVIRAARVRLSDHVRMTEVVYRGDRWFIVASAIGTMHLRCTPGCKAFLDLLDGTRTVGEALGSLDPAPDEAEVVRILAALREAGMLAGAAPAASAGTRWRARLMRPFAIQVRLFDPGALLSRMLPLAGMLFTRPALIGFAGLIAVAAVLALSESGALVEHFHGRFFDPANLVLLWFVYPVVKLIHEFAHGLACRRFGGEVREMGVMFLVFVPVPYVDASSSNTFADKYRRLLVAAAGVLAELVLASLALLVFVATTNGVIHDAAFNVVMIGAVSTLVFNGNPLMRFDGYYVFSDLVEIPGLAPRSVRYLGYLAKRYVFRLHNVSSPVTAAGERPWLFAYGIASFCYRATVIVAIAIAVAGKFFVLGMLLALWFVAFQLIVPLARSIRSLFVDAARAGHVARTAMGVVVLVVLFGTVSFVLPVPDNTSAEGVIVVPESAAVRVQVEGFVQDAITRPRSTVEAGDELARLANDEITIQSRVLAARLDEANTRYSSLLGRDATGGAIARDARRAAAELVTEAERKAAALVVTAPGDGTYVSLLTQDDVGRFLHKGEMIGYLEAGKTLTARIVVSQEDIDQVRVASNRIEAFVPGKGSVAVESGYREVPLGTTLLPSRSLGTAAGGSVEVDMRDVSGTRAMGRFFVLDLEVPADAVRVGQRTFVKFVHPPSPIGWRLARAIQRLIGRLSVSDGLQVTAPNP